MEPNTSLVTTEPKPLQFSDDQMRMIRNMCALRASASEFEVLMEIAKTKRLNPLLKQIWFLQIQGTWQALTSIHGIRSLAQRTGERNGESLEFEYEEDGRTLKLARATIYRKGHEHPYVGVAYWKEFNRGQALWKTMGHAMLGKCALVTGYRAAFPEDIAGLYVPEEMPEPNETAPHRSLTALDVKPLDDQELDEAPTDIEHLKGVMSRYHALLEKVPAEQADIVSRGVIKKGGSIATLEAAIKYMTDQLYPRAMFENVDDASSQTR